MLLRNIWLGAGDTGAAGVCDVGGAEARRAAGEISSALAWLLVVVALGWLVFSRNAPSSDPSAPHTAMVEIRGEIDAGGESSAEMVVSAMRGAMEDKGSRALVLVINSPGGSPVQAGIINDEINRLRRCTTSRCTRWWKTPARRRRITSLRRRTGFMWTRPVWSAASAS